MGIHRLLKQPVIKAAIERLQTARATEIQFTLNDVLANLWGFDQANVVDYFKEDVDGNITFKGLKDLTLEQQKNLKQLKIKSTLRKDPNDPKGKAVVEDQQIIVEVYDRQKNNMDIARVQGFLKENVQIDLGDALVNLLRERAGRHGKTINAETGEVET
jgi:hypothetical protein